MFCYCSPTTELLETVMPLLNHCSFYSHADCNMAESLIVRLEVALDSVHRFARKTTVSSYEVGVKSEIVTLAASTYY